MNILSSNCVWIWPPGGAKAISRQSRAPQHPHMRTQKLPTSVGRAITLCRLFILPQILMRSPFLRIPPDEVPVPGCVAHHVWRSAHPHADSSKRQSGGPCPETPRPAALFSKEDCSGDVLRHVVSSGSRWVHVLRYRESWGNPPLLVEVSALEKKWENNK